MARYRLVTEEEEIGGRYHVLEEGTDGRRVAKDLAKSTVTGAVEGAKDFGTTVARGAMTLFGPMGQFAVTGLENLQERVLPTPDYTPETTGGKYVQSGVRGAVGGGPFGLRGVVSGLSAGVGGEAGAQLSGNNPLGRLIGSLVGGFSVNMPGLLTQRPANIVKQATDGMTDEDWAAALARQAQANRQGISITGPEALGNKNLSATQLVVEQHPKSSLTMQRFMAQRPGQVTNAVTGVLDDIGPRPQDPRILGAQVKETAEDALTAARQGANTLSRPSYASVENIPGPASNRVVNASEELRQNGAVRAAITAVKSDKAWGIGKQEPNFSFRTLDAAKKWLDAQANGLRMSEPAKAAIFATARDKLTAELDNAFPDYAVARNVNQRVRADELHPRERSITGALSQTDDPVSQFRTLTDPQRANTSSVIKAAKDIKARNPKLYQETIRQGLQNEFDDALKMLQGSGQEFSGARFARAMRETPQTRENILALIRELPDGAVKAKGFERLLDTLELTGNRLPVGSRTAFNELQKSEMTGQGLIKQLTNPTAPLANWYDRVMMNFTSKKLAELFTDKDSAAKLKKLAMQPPGGPAARATVTSLFAADAGELQIDHQAIQRTYREGR